MITAETSNSDKKDHTLDFNNPYMAPEVCNGIITPKNDIYSLGKMIEYILNNEKLDYDYKSFFDENPDNRPSIFEILYNFNSIFSENINNLSIKYSPEIQDLQDLINSKYESNSTKHFSTLSENQNDPQTQYNLGFAYEKNI